MVVQPSLCRTWSEIPKTGFLTTRLIFKHTSGDSENKKKTTAETEASHTEVSSPVKQQIVETSPTGGESTVPVNAEIVDAPNSEVPEPVNTPDSEDHKPAAAANSVTENSVPEVETHKPLEESTVDTDIADPERQTVNSSPDKLDSKIDTVDPEPEQSAVTAVNSAKEQQVEPIEVSPVKPVSTSDSQEPVQQSTGKEDQEIIQDTNIQITEAQHSEDDSSSEEDMGGSKRKSAKHESKAEKKEKKEKESSRRSRRKSEKKEDDEDEKHVENGKKVDRKEIQAKDLGESGADGDKMDVEEENETEESAKTNGIEKDIKGTEENVNNSAEFSAKQRKSSGPTDMEASEKKGDKSKDEEMRGRKGSHSDGRMSRRKSDEKMESEDVGSHDKKAEQKHKGKIHWI